MASEKPAVKTSGESLQLFIAVGDLSAALVDVDLAPLHLAVFDVGQTDNFTGAAFLYDDSAAFLLFQRLQGSVHRAPEMSVVQRL